MEQTEYLQIIISAIEQNIELPEKEVINTIFKKLKPFHTHMLWEQSIEHSNIYFENILSSHINQKDMNKIGNIMVKNLSTTKQFFEHMFNKYPDFFITQHQENIINFDIDYFPILFPKTVFSSPKLTLCLYNLFQEHEKNTDKINFIIENQKKNYLT